MDDVQKWVQLVADELGVTGSIALAELLEITRDVAHQVARPAAPLTTYVIGTAMAGGADMVTVRAAVQRCLDEWAAASPAPAE